MENAREFAQQRLFLFAGEFGAFVFLQGGGDGGDGVHGGEFGEEFLAKVFAEDSADAVADGGAADVFFRHDESEAGGSAFFPAAVCFDARSFYFSSAAGGELEVFAPREGAVFRFQGGRRGEGEAEGGWGGWGGWGVRRRVARALCGGGRSGWRVRAASPSARENRVRACGECWRAGRCVSFSESGGKMDGNFLRESGIIHNSRRDWQFFSEKNLMRRS